jgi:hypothetical protein
MVSEMQFGFGMASASEKLSSDTRGFFIRTKALSDSFSHSQQCGESVHPPDF